MATVNHPIQSPGYLVSGVSAQVVGDVLDCRFRTDYAYLYASAAGNSAIWSLQASPDGTAFSTVATYTSTAGQMTTAQIAGFYPYVRAVVSKLYSAAGGTGQLWVHYSPGLR